MAAGEVHNFEQEWQLLWNHMTPERELWACALLVEREQGDNAAVYIAERIGALALEGDAAGVARWKAIAEKLSLLWTGERPLSM
jgi:hypothetical protein